MFILNLTYIKTIEEVDKFVAEHIKYLEKYYEENKFICSGRKNPRTGGIIVCNANSINEVESIIKEDPFYSEKVAKYDIIEFQPTKYAPDFKSFI